MFDNLNPFTQQTAPSSASVDEQPTVEVPKNDVPPAMSLPPLPVRPRPVINSAQPIVSNIQPRNTNSNLMNSVQEAFTPPVMEMEKAPNSLNYQVDITQVDSLLKLVVDHNASDLHLTAGYHPMIRVDGELQTIGSHKMTSEEIRSIVYQALKQTQQELFEINLEVDVAYSLSDGNRFRINAYHSKSSVAAAFRLIPSKIRTLKDLQLPDILTDFTRLPQGFVLVTGPTGSGKSTTLAAILEEINENQNKHILTIEDPIEYVYSAKRSLVDQREINEDTHSWSVALRSALRQDPNVVLIGEMRDFETIEAALTIAETGHLVFATVHTNSAAQSIDRIIDVFPPHQQQQVRVQLSNVLQGVLSQRLVPTIGGGRRCALELMFATPAVRSLIREGKTYQLDNVISTSLEMGMISLERSLVNLIREGKITIEQAQQHTLKPDEMMKLLKMT